MRADQPRSAIKRLVMLVGVVLKPRGHVWEFIDHMGLFGWIGFHVEKGEFNTILPVFPCHAVSARLDHGAVLVRKMQFPSAVAADDAFEHTARGKA